MVKIKMFSEVEGDARVGDEVDVDRDRAQLLVVRGHATYVDGPALGDPRVDDRTAPKDAPKRKQAPQPKPEKEDEEGQD